MPGGQRQSSGAGGFQCASGMRFGQGEQSLQDAQARDAAVFHHGKGPGGGVRADQTGAIEQPIGAALDDGPLVIVDVSRVGAETTRVGSGMQGDGFQAVDQPRWCNTRMACCWLTLSWFISRKSPI